MTKTELLKVVKTKNKSMAGLGRRLQVEKSCISKYFAGDRSPGVPTMRQMAKILDLDFIEVVEAFYGPDDRTAEQANAIKAELGLTAATAQKIFFTDDRTA